MNDIFLIDTNILVYAYDVSVQQKREIAMTLVKECWEGKKKLGVSVQNLSEFYVVTTEKIEHPLEKQEAHKIVKEITESKNWTILEIKKENVLGAIELSINHESSYWDALLASTMRKNNVITIYTENIKDFSKFPGVRTINPFAIKEKKSR